MDEMEESQLLLLCIVVQLQGDKVQRRKGEKNNNFKKVHNVVLEKKIFID